MNTTARIIAACVGGVAALTLTAPVAASSWESTYPQGGRQFVAAPTSPTEDDTDRSCREAIADEGGRPIATGDLTVVDGSPVPYQWRYQDPRGEVVATCYTALTGTTFGFVY